MPAYSWASFTSDWKSASVKSNSRSVSITGSATEATATVAPLRRYAMLRFRYFSEFFPVGFVADSGGRCGLHPPHRSAAVERGAALRRHGLCRLGSDRNGTF